MSRIANWSDFLAFLRLWLSSLPFWTTPLALSGGHAPCANAIEALLDEFPKVLLSSFDSTTPPAHGVKHVVPTVGTPVFAHPRRPPGVRQHDEDGNREAFVVSLGFSLTCCGQGEWRLEALWALPTA